MSGPAPLRLTTARWYFSPQPAKGIDGEPGVKWDKVIATPRPLRAVPLRHRHAR